MKFLIGNRWVDAADIIAEREKGGKAKGDKNTTPAAPKNTAEFVAAIQARNAEAGIKMTEDEVKAIGTNAEKKAYLEDDENFKKPESTKGNEGGEGGEE